MPASTTVHVACRAADDRTRNSNRPTKASRPRPHARIAALPSCGKRSIGILLLLAPGQFFRQTSETPQLPIVQKLAIDHSDNQLLHRAAAEPVDNLLNRGYRQ